MKGKRLRRAIGERVEDVKSSIGDAREAVTDEAVVQGAKARKALHEAARKMKRTLTKAKRKVT